MLATIMQMHHLMSVGYWWYRIYRQSSLQLLLLLSKCGQEYTLAFFE